MSNYFRQNQLQKQMCNTTSDLTGLNRSMSSNQKYF